MRRSRAQTTAHALAAEAGGLRLADRITLACELEQLEDQLLVPATRVRRAETISKQLARDTDTLRRLLDRADSATISRAQKDRIGVLTQRIRDGRSDHQALGDLTAHREPLERAEAIRGELHRRHPIQTSMRVRAAAASAPEHLTAALGPRPPRADERAAWDRGAQIIESYRQRFAPDLTPDQPGLGPQPVTGHHLRAWHVFHQQLEPVLEQLQQPALPRHASPGHREL